MKLTEKDMIIEIRRKATDEELVEYLSKDQNETSIKLEVAFAKYIEGVNKEEEPPKENRF